MNCQSCKKQKSNLRAVASAIIPQVDIIICGECVKKGWEPRHIIILGARRGVDVRNWIVGHKYHGAELLAEEIIV